MRFRNLALVAISILVLVSEGFTESRSKTLYPGESDLSFELNSNFIQGSGRFTKFSGSMRVDPKDLTQSVISFEMDPVLAQFDSGAVLLQSLVQQLPPQPIHFTSDTLRATGPGRYFINGTLSSRGKTRRVAFPLTIKHLAKGDIVIQGDIDSSQLELPIPALEGQEISGNLNYRLVFR